MQLASSVSAIESSALWMETTGRSSHPVYDWRNEEVTKLTTANNKSAAYPDTVERLANIDGLDIAAFRNV